MLKDNNKYKRNFTKFVMTNDPFKAQRQFERMFNLQPHQIYCDDFAQDVSLADRVARRVQEFQPVKSSGEVMGYSLINYEEGCVVDVGVKDYQMLKDENCLGCIVYNDETGEQRIVSQKEFEKAYILSRVEKERRKKLESQQNL